jgi:hypothetical protein
LLDRFRAGDDTVLDTLNSGTIEWTNVVAERWTRQVSDTLTARLQSLSKQLQTGLDRAGGDCFAISNSLLMARRALAPLRAFAGMSSIPADVQRNLESELNRWAGETQKSLEGAAERVRNDQGRLLKTMRDHSLTAVTEPAPHVSAAENQPAPYRRVIL